MTNNTRRKMNVSDALTIMYLVFIAVVIAEYVTRTGAYVEYNHALTIAGWGLTPFVVICAARSFYGDYKRWKAKKAKK